MEDFEKYIEDNKIITQVEIHTREWFYKAFKWDGKINIVLVIYGMLRPIFKKTLELYENDHKKLSNLINLILSDINNSQTPQA